MLSDSSLECVTPASTISGLVDFSVLINGEEASSESTSFRYMDAVIVTSCSPKYGGVSGGDVVLVRGLSFAGTENVKCSFGSTMADARVLNSTALECVSPSGAAAGEVPLGLSFDGMIVSTSVLYTYMVPPEIVAIVPAVGSTQGNTSVTVTGSGFSLGSELECVFDSDAVPAVYVSDSEWNVFHE